ncbi:MAG: ABC transporter permease [Planctomycetes bacterium]|jgi:putative ABC transport system permease protein|nr:ABC transporter permease [Planctomycetota bacterium]MBT4029071.1 ABC transporter permease [Planctomycetota bacterium]MBT4560309.1 ABC transporter permease [Planctomycetota bacterium]MBT5101667.1 ABC transporter permease [Planctomycetota bacterium]MBT5119705.1 ABC transporter permease [Planctomycetota bacterium]
MNTPEIALVDLVFVLLPALAVIVVLAKWSLDAKNALYAFARMLGQLLLIGYFLTFLFETEHSWVVLLVLGVMVAASSWIALSSVKPRRAGLYRHAFVSIAVGGGITLVAVTAGVLKIEPWFEPRYMIPLAGMIFANAMNSVSLAADRFYAEVDRGETPLAARRVALQTSLIPIMNSLFAVGLVSIPGMMTGQILSGVTPFVASRYQIMVMLMIFASAGLSSVSFLWLTNRDK